MLLYWEYPQNGLIRNLRGFSTVLNHNWKIIMRDENSANYSFIVKLKRKLQSMKIGVISISSITQNDIIKIPIFCLCDSRDKAIAV